MTAPEINREIARLRNQLRDWEWLSPCGDVEIEINGQIADLRDELNEIEDFERDTPAWAASFAA